MAEGILILAASGAGKTYSCRTLDPDKTLLISVDGKRPPFSLKDWPKLEQDGSGSYYVPKKSNLYGSVKAAIKASDKKTIVIDDSQYLMANSFFSRAHERGFDKFNELGQQFWLFLDFLRELPDDVTFYLLHHIDENDAGHVKPKTLGKMLDDKGCVEGRFTVCLKAYREEGIGHFSARVEGQDVFKAPEGMFSEDPMSNDLAVVDKEIREFWGI
jgi:hypothetical protein